MASKAAMEPGKNLSINKPMEEGKTNSPYNNKDQFKDNEEKKSNANTVIYTDSHPSLLLSISK